MRKEYKRSDFVTKTDKYFTTHQISNNQQYNMYNLITQKSNNDFKLVILVAGNPWNLTKNNKNKFPFGSFCCRSFSIIRTAIINQIIKCFKKIAFCSSFILRTPSFSSSIKTKVRLWYAIIYTFITNTHTPYVSINNLQ